MNNERKAMWFYCDYCKTLTPEQKLHLKDGEIYCDTCYEELFGKVF